MKPKAKTGPGVMVMAAVEQAFPEGRRILDDELAFPILPPRLKVLAWLLRRFKNWMVRKSEERVPGMWAGLLARKRYIDDQAARAVADGVRAAVNLGAGLDTRAYRLPCLKELPVWEVDLPENISVKRSRLERLFRPAPSNVSLVAVDFDRESLATKLGTHGYSFADKSFLIWEGVTQYLTEEGFRATLEDLSRAQAGSRLVFTYVPEEFISGRSHLGQPYLYEQMIVNDKLWHFGIEPSGVAKLLGDYGWKVVEHLGYDELAERYVAPTGRELASMKIERIVCAERA